jgi:hypothetical protein
MPHSHRAAAAVNALTGYQVTLAVRRKRLTDDIESLISASPVTKPTFASNSCASASRP